MPSVFNFKEELFAGHTIREEATLPLDPAVTVDDIKKGRLLSWDSTANTLVLADGTNEVTAVAIVDRIEALPADRRITVIVKGGFNRKKLLIVGAITDKVVAEAAKNGIYIKEVLD